MILDQRTISKVKGNLDLLAGLDRHHLRLTLQAMDRRQFNALRRELQRACDRLPIGAQDRPYPPAGGNQ